MKEIKFRTIDWLTVIIFATLLFDMASMQIHMKPKPQFGMIAIGILAIVFTITKVKDGAIICLGLILILLFLINGFMLHRGLLNLTGMKDSMGISSFIFSVIFTATATWVYFANYPRKEFLETSLMISFLVITTTIFIIYEL